MMFIIDWGWVGKKGFNLKQILDECLLCWIKRATRHHLPSDAQRWWARGEVAPDIQFLYYSVAAPMAYD